VYSLNALLRMLRTVERNLTGAKNAAILERAAINPNFPVSALPAFHQLVKTKASEFLWDIDGNMRRREAGTTKGKRIRVGVEIFAFEEPLVQDAYASRAPRTARGAPQIRGGPGARRRRRP
jgi:hypothetical protein